MQRRNAIGGIGLTLFVLATIRAMTTPTSWSGDPLIAACLRIGIVMVLIWLAYPELERAPRWLMTVITVAGVIVALRPRLAMVLVPATLVALWLRKNAD